MESESSLIFGYSLDGEGGALKLEEKEISNWDESKGVMWLHLNYSCPSILDWLSTKFELDDWAIEALTDDEPRSRTLINNKYIFTCLRSVNLSQDDEQEDMVSIRVYMKGNLIITSRSRELFYLKNICHLLLSSNGPKTSIQLLESIMESINDDSSEHINFIVDSIDEIEQNYLMNSSDIKRDDISNLRRKVLMLKRYLAPQKEAIRQFTTQQILSFNANDKLSFQQHYDNTARNVEELDLARERCSLLQEQMTNKLSEQLNNRMYLFSMITALFLPISSVASLFGMNLGGIPGTNSSWGFALVCFLLLINSVGLMIYLRKKQWF